MRDSIELESRGVPVALITASGRIPTITRRGGIYYLSHFFGDRFRPEALNSTVGQRGIAKFSYHRQLRLAGCKEGDDVDVAGTRVKWKFPSREFEESRLNWPAGFAKWHLTIDGIKRFMPIETPDPTVGLPASEIEERVRDLTPKVFTMLTDAPFGQEARR